MIVMSILFHPEFNIINVTESKTGISCEYVFIENSKLYKYVVRRYDNNKTLILILFISD